MFLQDSVKFTASTPMVFIVWCYREFPAWCYSWRLEVGVRVQCELHSLQFCKDS